MCEMNWYRVFISQFREPEATSRKIYRHYINIFIYVDTQKLLIEIKYIKTIIDSVNIIFPYLITKYLINVVLDKQI